MVEFISVKKVQKDSFCPINPYQPQITYYFTEVGTTQALRRRRPNQF
jgi:hypothetical protein